MFRALTLAAPLALGLAALPFTAGATDIGAMTEDERAAFRAEIRAYLLDNPEVLMEAIGVLEQREADSQAETDAATVAALSEQLFENPDSWVGGNPEGSVTIVEFLDYRCGYCKRAHPEVAALLEQDNDIRLIVKEFPILGEQSVLASRYALAVRRVAGDAVYADIADALMAMRSDVTEPGLARLSDTYDIDHEAVEIEMASPEIDRIIGENRQLAQMLQINGTPSFIFGDQMVRGYVPLDTMLELVDALREG